MNALLSGMTVCRVALCVRSFTAFISEPPIPILDLQRHNMTKTHNKIPAKISDFTVFKNL
jgi:hypothetical protein